MVFVSRLTTQCFVQPVLPGLRRFKLALKPLEDRPILVTIRFDQSGHSMQGCFDLGLRDCTGGLGNLGNNQSVDGFGLDQTRSALPSASKSAAQIGAAKLGSSRKTLR